MLVSLRWIVIYLFCSKTLLWGMRNRFS